MDQQEIPDHVKKLQSHFFGQIYAGANLASARINNEHAKRISEWLKQKKGMMLLSGNPGCGKTYICAATLAWMHGKVRDIYVHDEADFMSRVKASFDMKGDSDDEARYLIDHEFYIYDDLGSTGSGSKEEGNINWKQKMWFILLEERKVCNLPTIITTNFNRKQLAENLGERSYSRLFSKDNCIIEMFNYPDLRGPLSWREDAPKDHLKD